MTPLRCLVIGLACLLISGCIEFEAATHDLPPPPKPSPKRISAANTAGHGNVTASETSEVRTGPCAGAFDHQAAAASYMCATKTHWIGGDIDLASWPVDLASFNGNVEVQGGAGGQWNLTVTLQARGESESAARANLENILFNWNLEPNGDRSLTAQAKKRDQTTRNHETARFSLTVPAAVVLTLDAATTNGDAIARGLQTDGLRLVTTNGAVIAQDLTGTDLVLRSTNGEARVSTVSADSIEVATTNGAIGVSAAVADATLQTTNGAIEAKIRPSRDGEIEASTTNGPISIELPEDEDHGHDVRASTTNGVATIGLEDGSTSGSTKSKTFRTNGYADREIQTKTTATSTNAVVEVQGY